MPPNIEEPKIQELTPQDLPTVEQTQNLMESVRKLLNPNGDNPKVDLYITSTFGYITQMMYKVATASDKDKAVEEIAEDLKSRFEGWANEQKAILEAKQNNEVSPPNNEKTE